jgi:hypothetical protein
MTAVTRAFQDNPPVKLALDVLELVDEAGDVAAQIRDI